MHRSLPLAALPLALLLATSPARAETQNCMEITSLPVTLTTQGVYCLKNDLATDLASGYAIKVATNNVTIDCNGFKIGGLAAGTGTRTVGIDVQMRNNVTVRNCAVRGFFLGIQFQNGGTHIAEDNRLEANTYIGIGSFGTSGDIIRRNLVTDTGGVTPAEAFPDGRAYGIVAQSADGLVLDDNVVATVFNTAGATLPPSGIAAFDVGGVIRDNVVSNVVAEPGLTRYGINGNISALVIRDNSILGSDNPGYGIYADGDSYCADNHIRGYTTSKTHQCTDGGGNTP